MDSKEFKKFRKRLNNADSLIDFMNDLRQEGLFMYERTAYTYGMELDQVSGISAPEGYKWKIYKGTEDITYEAEGILLEDETEYTIRLEET